MDGVIALLAGLAGLAAGAAARMLLSRLRRGVRVPPPWCELAVATLWAVAGWRCSAGAVPVPWLPVLVGLAWLTVALSATDLAHRRLPDALTLPALPVALALLSPVGGPALTRALLGAVVLAGGHAAVHLLSPAALGAGDVKLAASLGAVLAAVSWPALLLGPLLAAGFTATAALAGLALRRLRCGDALPHGPAMLTAAWLITLLGAAAR